MKNHVVIKNLCKSYDSQIVLNNVNAEFEEGKIHGIVGKNGSGKTVLIKSICGFIIPTEGYVIVDGKIIGKDVDFPESVGAIIEVPGFCAHLTAYKNLEYLASIKNTIDKNEIINTIKQVGLDPFSKKKYSKFSLGMKQRLGIAQAIMEKPKLLILDEPLNGLDKSGVNDIRKLILQYKDLGNTIILISHNKVDIDTLCDYVYEIESGNLVQINFERV